MLRQAQYLSSGYGEEAGEMADPVLIGRDESWEETD